MKYIPILFSTLMVQALLTLRKTKTRRTNGLDKVNMSPSSYKFIRLEVEKGVLFAIFQSEISSVYEFKIKCPYGKVGDVLWVRETFRVVKCLGEDMVDYAASPCETYSINQKWKPSIHMPKEACRLFLEITNIKVERLQDISEQDAIAEGAKDYLKVDEMTMLKGLGDWIIPKPFGMHQFGFLSIWCKINGCKSWLANPWVWVIEFKQISKPDNF